MGNSTSREHFRIFSVLELEIKYLFEWVYDVQYYLSRFVLNYFWVSDSDYVIIS